MPSVSNSKDFSVETVAESPVDSRTSRESTPSTHTASATLSLPPFATLEQRTGIYIALKDHADIKLSWLVALCFACQKRLEFMAEFGKKAPLLAADSQHTAVDISEQLFSIRYAV